jgi:hypothetical protein
MGTVLFWVSGSILVILVCVLVDRRARKAFEKQFPPISDAEFLARCTPGVSPDVALKVRRIFAESLCVEYACIYPSSRLIEDLGAD